jgi:endonuclease/exonuclease/phosphatase family metal-dependent hydrolase
MEISTRSLGKALIGRLLTLLLIITACYPFLMPGRRSNHVSMPFSRVSMEKEVSNTRDELKLITYNILAPCYNRVSSNPIKKYESDLEDVYMKRNERICEKILEKDADIICLQEFWSQCEPLRNLFVSKLSSQYLMKELRRTSHWRTRDDGLAVFINKDRLRLLDSKDILFHDCGDRVAQLLLLGLKPADGAAVEDPADNKQFICINTHLLFPHNEYSTKIRVREVSKILDFVEAYRQTDLCKSICGRSDVRLPVIIAGDFNGSPKGAVFQLMQSQNYRSAQEEYWCTTGSEYCLGSSSNTAAATTPSPEGISSRSRWVSHKSHRNEIIPVDHVFFCNPSDQVESRLPSLPDWTNLVYRELQQRIAAELGTSSMREAFSIFDQDNTNYVTREAFKNALQRLGFDGEGAAALTKEEIDLLVESADKNGDGLIDYKEFCDRFWIASENVEQPSGLKGMKSAYMRSRWLLKDLSSSNSEPAASFAESEADDLIIPERDDYLGKPMGDLKVRSVSLYPKELEEGIWPSDYDLSDHGLVEVIFAASASEASNNADSTVSS